MPVFQGVPQVPDPLGVGRGELGADLLAASAAPSRAPQVLAVAAEAKAADLQPAQRLLKRLLERAADRHRLADALHLRRQRRIGFGKLFEGEPRDLGDDIVDRRLETGRRFARDVVGQFVQSVADGQLGGDLGDRKTGRLATPAHWSD